MLKLRVGLGLLFSACTFHAGDTRGVSSDLPDELVGTWQETLDSPSRPAIPRTLTFGEEPRFDDDPVNPFFAAGGADAGGVALTWAREDTHLISILGASTGPETVQAELHDEVLSLTWRVASTLEIRKLTRVP